MGRLLGHRRRGAMAEWVPRHLESSPGGPQLGVDGRGAHRELVFVPAGNLHIQRLLGGRLQTLQGQRRVSIAQTVIACDTTRVTVTEVRSEVTGCHMPTEHGLGGREVRLRVTGRHDISTGHGLEVRKVKSH